MCDIDYCILRNICVGVAIAHWVFYICSQKAERALAFFLISVHLRNHPWLVTSFHVSLRFLCFVGQ